METAYATLVVHYFPFLCFNTAVSCEIVKFCLNINNRRMLEVLVGALYRDAIIPAYLQWRVV